MNANLPEDGLKRIVIIGAGFAGLNLAQKLLKSNYQIVLVDQHNYHQFPPLFYQVATAALEPSDISFPLRKLFQNKKIHLRVANVTAIDPDKQVLHTNIGDINYDYLVLAMGTTSNYFGNDLIKKHAMPLKSVIDAIDVRNHILKNYEQALSEDTVAAKAALMTIVVVGGGATGVEISGAIAEMKKYILPKDYFELNFDSMKIYLIEGTSTLLTGMSKVASGKAQEYLTKAGVEILFNVMVKDYDGETVVLGNGDKISTKNLIWAAGVTANTIEGITPTERGNRLKVDSFNRVENYKNIYAIGDVAYMTEPNYPQGHPQVAQVAIQQATHLANHFKNKLDDKKSKPFAYKNRGSMATIGRNRAVVDLPYLKFQGFLAWLTWMFVHLGAILGVQKKVMIFTKWLWHYVTYDESLRFIFDSKRSVDNLPESVKNQKK